MLTVGSAEAMRDNESTSSSGDLIEWRPAKAQDIVDYYGIRPPHTIKAIVVLRNGEPEGICGVARGGGVNLFFSEYKEGLEPHLKKMTVLRAIKAAISIAEEYPSELLGEAITEKGANIMKRIGFTKTKDNSFGLNKDSRGD
jgi:hypothetical protein